MRQQVSALSSLWNNPQIAHLVEDLLLNVNIYSKTTIRGQESLSTMHGTHHEPELEIWFTNPSFHAVRLWTNHIDIMQLR